MKRIFVIVLWLAISTLCHCQVVSFSKVINFEGKTADELYSYSQSWITNTFSTPNKVIQLDNPDNRYISCKGTEEFSMGKMTYLAYDGWVDYTLIIQINFEGFIASFKQIIYICGVKKI